MAGEGSGEFGEGLGNSTAVDVDGDVTSDESESEMIENAMIARHERGAVNDGNYDSEDLVSEEEEDDDEEDGDGAMELDEDGNRYDDPDALKDNDGVTPSVAKSATTQAKSSAAKPAATKPAVAGAALAAGAAAAKKVASKPKAVGKGKTAARPRPTDDAVSDAPPAAKKQRVAKLAAAGSSSGKPGAPRDGMLNGPTKKAIREDATKYLERARSKGLTAKELIKSIKKQAYFKPQKQLIITFLVDLLPRISVQKKIEGEERYILEKYFVKKNKF